MAKKTKKIDVKKVAKVDLSKALLEFLREAGYEVEDGMSRGFTEGSLVVATEATDVQVKLITPKAGVTRYAVLDEEEGEMTLEPSTAE